MSTPREKKNAQWSGCFLLTGYGVGVGGGGQFLGPESLKKSHMERIDVFDGLFDHLHLL
jgi:hypothetical protein